MPSKPKVWIIGTLGVVVYFQGNLKWFDRWRDAYDWAYTAARVRNVAADALGALP